ncbi:MAG TPA: FAD-dependent oxidoreductase [Myxococcota bacterium]|nr:FAD-dependent oxidoreductase [Myxococcota bacterium]
MGSVRHGVVVGGSISGLVAAGVLARHFDRVTLIERDSYPETPATRKGTPQARHVHVLLKQGERAIARIFPGLFEELVARGGQRVDTARDAKWFYFGGWKLRFESGVEMVSQSRPLLEWSLRRRVAALPNVEFVTADVHGLDAPTPARVGGVQLRRGAGTASERLAADFVVDATGRGSRLPHWLEALGCGAPPESEVKVDVGYATRAYRRTRAPRDWTALLCHPRFPDTRCGVLLPIEDEQWLLTLVGWFGDHPPGRDPEFLGWARGLAIPDLVDAVAEAEPLSEIALHRFPSNRRRHYERLARLPDGLAVLGDAACSFNPVYAQGMATAALGAAELDDCLAEARSLDGLSRRFQARLAHVTDAPWLLATGEDFRSERALGERPAFMPLLAWYTARVHQLTWRDPFTAKRFLEVMHLMRRPTALFHPRVALRALTSL